MEKCRFPGLTHRHPKICPRRVSFPMFRFRVGRGWGGSWYGEHRSTGSTAPARRKAAAHRCRSHGARRRLRRYRDQRALWVQTGRRCGGNHLARNRDGHRVRHPLVAGPDRFVQICHPDHARRQPRRGRHHRIVGASRCSQRAARQLARLPDDRRFDRGCAALRRWGHHAGHLGAKRR